MKKTVAIYARTSTDLQQTGLEAQIRALESYCKNNEINEYKVYSDFGVSGAKESRPELNSLMEDCKDGKIDTVIVYSFSRFARSTMHLLKAMNFFNESNISFVSLSEQLDTSSPMGRAVFTIISAISQLERELISERVKNGLVNAKSKGKTLGRPKSVKKELVIELLREEQFTYKKIANLLGCSKASVGRIALELKSKKEIA